MNVEVKLMDGGHTVMQRNAAPGSNSAFLYSEFQVFPQVGELIVLHAPEGGLYVVVAVAHEIRDNRAHPIVVMDKWNGETRQAILEKCGWLPGQELGSSAIDVERMTFDN